RGGHCSGRAVRIAPCFPRPPPRGAVDWTYTRRCGMRNSTPAWSMWTMRGAERPVSLKGMNIDAEVAELAALAHSCATRCEFPAVAMRRFEQVLGFDVGITFDDPRTEDPQATIVGFDEKFWRLLVTDAAHLVGEIEPLVGAAAAGGGVSLDTEVFTLAI